MMLQGILYLSEAVIRTIIYFLFILSLHNKMTMLVFIMIKHNIKYANKQILSLDTQ